MFTFIGINEEHHLRANRMLLPISEIVRQKVDPIVNLIGISY